MVKAHHLSRDVELVIILVSSLAGRLTSLLAVILHNSLRDIKFISTECHTYS